MTIIPLAIINCSVVELLLQVFALEYVSYGEQHCITSPKFFSIGSYVIIADDNQGNASAQSCSVAHKKTEEIFSASWL